MRLLALASGAAVLALGPWLVLQPTLVSLLGVVLTLFLLERPSLVEEAQAAGRVIEAPARMIAFSLAALISQLALRRLATDDGVPASVVADFVVTLLLDGLRPRKEHAR